MRQSGQGGSSPAPRGAVAARPAVAAVTPTDATVSMPPAAVSDELRPGTRLGEYQIVGKLGEGGMGCVYSATHPLIGKRAAIKVISSALCTDPEAVGRFVQEARAANQIGHPNIVDVFSFGTLPDGRCYFVMEWLQGETLSARMARSRLSFREAVDLLDPICAALEAAHEKGIIHRDLKPDNVFLCAVRAERPRPTLLDFGIAKLAGPEDSGMQRTRTGMMMGTPLYMSPEQARGRGIDHRTDLYSLGVMAYEMMLGQTPFSSDNAADIIAMHLHQPPPSPRSLWPEIPGPLDALLRQMLDKDPTRRGTLPEIRALLNGLRGGPTLVGGPASVPPPRPTPAPTQTAADTAGEPSDLLPAPRHTGRWVALGAAAAAISLLVLLGHPRGGKVSPPPPSQAPKPQSAATIAPAAAPAPPPTPAVTPAARAATPAAVEPALPPPPAQAEVPKSRRAPGGSATKTAQHAARSAAPKPKVQQDDDEAPLDPFAHGKK